MSSPRGWIVGKRWRFILPVGLCTLFAVCLAALPTAAGEPTFVDQPDTMSSSISMYYTNSVYDWELANMVKMWIADAGCDNMLFFFNQCHGGGLIDDLTATLGDAGDIALMAAAKHDEPAWMLDDTWTPSDESTAMGFDQPRSYYSYALGQQLARGGSDAPAAHEMAVNAEANDLAAEGKKDWNGTKRTTKVEHPQAEFVGEGRDLKIGRNADGTKVTNTYVIMFAGEPDAATVNDVDQAYKAFTDGQNIPKENITVLMGQGPEKNLPTGQKPPDYVSDYGARDDLFDAIKALGSKVGPNTQFIFWVNGHGDNDKTTLYLDRAIADPIKVPVPARPAASGEAEDTNIALDPDFLDAVRGNQAGNPYIGLFVDTQFNPDHANDLTLDLNGESLTPQSVLDVHALDDQPDLDGYQILFPMPDVNVLQLDNTLDVGWQNPDTFTPYTLFGFQISTGSVRSRTDFGTEPGPGPSSDVLIAVPNSFSPEELFTVTQGYQTWGYTPTIVTPGSPSSARSAVSQLDPPVEYLQLPDATMSGYGGLTFLGYGWYTEWYVPVEINAQSPPSYADDVGRLIDDAIQQDSVIGGIGPGVYPLIYSGLLPPGTQVATYDCPDLYSLAEMYGLDPIVATDPAPTGSSQFGPLADTVVAHANGAVIVTLSVPSTWYAPSLGSLLVQPDHYGPGYDDYFYEWRAAHPLVE